MPLKLNLRSLPSLEQRLCPPGETARPRMDRIVLGMLAMLLVLLPAWPPLFNLTPGGVMFHGERFFNDCLGQMLSVYLLPALGMLLAMRCGAMIGWRRISR